jgi:hypothetical protein
MSRLLFHAAVVLVGWLLLTSPSKAGSDAPDQKDEPKAALSEGLENVPSDSAAFLSIRPIDLWGTGPTKAFRDKLAEGAPSLLQSPPGMLGPLSYLVDGFISNPKEVTRVTYVVTPTALMGIYKSVYTSKAYEEKNILHEPDEFFTTEEVGDRKLFVRRNSKQARLIVIRAVCFLNDRTYLDGDPEALRVYLKGPTPKADGLLAPAFTLAAEKHAVAAGIDVSALAGGLEKQLPAESLVQFKPLFKARYATLLVDAGNRLDGSLRVTFADEAGAKDGEKALAAALDLVRDQLSKGVEAVAKSPEGMAANLDLLKQVRTGLGKAAVERDGATLRVDVAVTIDAKTAESAAAELLEKFKK